MRLDEIQHAETAFAHGAAELPGPVKVAMKYAAKIMTSAAYRL
jgi:ubiquinone biosynthesis monooxygenase Coq7